MFYLRENLFYKVLAQCARVCYLSCCEQYEKYCRETNGIVCLEELNYTLLLTRKGSFLY